MDGFGACTIVARNYLPAARVLARSFARHHPGSVLSALVIDDPPGVSRPDEPFHALTLHDVGLGGPWAGRWPAPTRCWSSPPP